MKKSCCICKNSIEVKYIQEFKYSGVFKHTVLFCVALPPSLKKGSQTWADIKVGREKLNRYCKYPIVFLSEYDREYAPCSLYCKTENKKKISRYEEIIESKKQKKEEVKKKAQEKKNIAQEMQRQRKIEHEIEKKKKDKIRLENIKIKNRRKYQREYRKRKKEEQTLLKIEQNKVNNRFEILDI